MHDSIQRYKVEFPKRKVQTLPEFLPERNFDVNSDEESNQYIQISDDVSNYATYAGGASSTFSVRASQALSSPPSCFCSFTFRAISAAIFKSMVCSRIPLVDAAASSLLVLILRRFSIGGAEDLSSERLWRNESDLCGRNDGRVAFMIGLLDGSKGAVLDRALVDVFG